MFCELRSPGYVADFLDVQVVTTITPRPGFFLTELVELLQEANQQVSPFLITINNENGSGGECHNKAEKMYIDPC